MKTKYAVLSSLFFIIQLVGVLPLRAEHYYFKEISLKEGLPSNVRCILRATAEQRLHVPHGRGREEYHRLFLLPCPGRNPLWRQGQDLQI